MVGRDRAVSSTEFWRLSPEEVHWLLAGRQPRRKYGKMDEETVKEIYEEEIEDLPTPTPDEAEQARQARREYQAALDSGNPILIAKARKERGIRWPTLQ